jgi:hypothetical protein
LSVPFHAVQPEGGSADKVAGVAAGEPAEGVPAKEGAGSSCTRRTVMALRAKGNALDSLPAGLPRGPWHDAEAAKTELRAWCLDSKTSSPKLTPN